MQITYQTIAYDSGLPARVRLEKAPSDRCRGEPHWHREPELLYVMSGEVRLTVAKHTRILKSGEVCVINSGEIHSLKAISARFLSVHLFYDFIKQFEPRLDSCSFALEDDSPRQREMLALLQKLAAIEQTDGDPYAALKKQAQLMRLIRLLLLKCRRQKQISIYGAGDSQTTHKRIIENYIDAHFREKITLSDIAGAIGRNEYYMSLYFKQLMGDGFCDYLKKVRAKHAVEDLATLDISIEEIALRNGFGNRNLVTKACKLYYGVTPMQIKKQAAKLSAHAPLTRSA